VTIAELYELLYIVLEAADRVFQFWMSASFAIVIAAFLAADRLSKRMYQLITFAYLLVSLNMFLRYAVNANRFAAIRTELVERGEWYDVPTSLAAGVTQGAVFIIGTVGTLYFVWQTYKARQNDV